MSCVLTQGYNLNCRDSIGGASTVYFIEYDNVSSISVTDGTVTEILKAGSSVFYKYKLVANTGEGNDDGSGSRELSSLYYIHKIAFPINKMTVAVRNELMLLAKNRLLIVLVDENGNAWLYGRDYGMMLSTANARTGRATADRNGYELTFESEERNPELLVDISVIETLEVPESEEESPEFGLVDFDDEMIVDFDNEQILTQ